MGLFFKEDQGRLHFILRLAFERVKNDMHHLFSWVHYFNSKHSEHDQRLARLEHSLYYSPNREGMTREEVKQLIDSHLNSHAHFENIFQKIQSIHARLDQIESQRQSQETMQDSRIALKERLMKKITQNSKDYLKTVVLGLIRKYGRISGPQLKEIVVEEQGICSKSSFYRLLAELEQENEVTTLSDSREKVYFAKQQIVK